MELRGTRHTDRSIHLMADVMGVEEAGVLDCFMQAGAELQRTQLAPEADAFTFAQIAGHEGVWLAVVEQLHGVPPVRRVPCFPEAYMRKATFVMAFTPAGDYCS